MISDKIKKILSEILGDDSLNVNSDTRLAELGLDSFEVVELIASAEKVFGIRLKIKDFKQFDTLGDIAGFIEKNKS